MNWTEEEIAERNRRVFPESLGRRELAGAMKLAPEPQPDAPEALVQEECTKILVADGWRALRTDPVSDRGRGKGFGEVGMADYFYIRYSPSIPLGRDAKQTAQLMWVEFKRGRGGVLSKSQRKWHTDERARGALTLIAGEDFAPSVAGFRAWYAGSGLQRRRDL